MPDPRRKNCRCCGKHEREAGQISWRGNCLACAHLLQAENIVGISQRTGYAHRRRLRGYARYVERAMEDSAPPPLAS